MNEEIKTETAPQEPTGTEANNGVGSESKTTPVIEAANKAALELKAENDRKEALLKREEQLEARRILGGQTAGKGQEVVKKEETPKEYTQRVMKGQI